MSIHQITFFDDERRNKLLPLTFTRPVAEMRVGITTIAEKWIQYTDATISYCTEDYLQKKFLSPQSSPNIYINGACIPDDLIIDALQKLNIGEALIKEETVIGFKSDVVLKNAQECIAFTKSLKAINYTDALIEIKNTWDIFKLNDAVLRQDFLQITKDRTSEKFSDTNTIIGNQIFIEEGAIIQAAIINTETGPVYIGKDAEVMEGSVIRGPIALCDHSTLKMSSKIYGATTIGPHCKVGGEVNNSVIFGYSNKAHDGFLGNSVIGEWCNLGADTNNSNLKNNYAEVKLWDYSTQKFAATGLQFCGLIMGDHSKCGINTMFNTGTVVGVSANIFGAGFPRNYIPSFSWGGAGGFTDFKINQALEVAEQVMGRRQIELTETDKEILQYLFETRISK
ncbi:MAG: GlmU family protein [Bacteroidetes bacterium]|nr:GlmU family protein [Bacteroidota bacterium]MBP7398639.1 GlmU family protein [Chitinophagales bacterium]MBP8753659.1 GlmU family protein [Chitinophagales bacterium]MBP9188022.1 GlmU family protein [Chitinophagales bacterium]MBP9547653.1 GlmU family protein [Chitinophagales bacterium]